MNVPLPAAVENGINQRPRPLPTLFPFCGVTDPPPQFFRRRLSLELPLALRAKHELSHGAGYRFDEKDSLIFARANCGKMSVLQPDWGEGPTVVPSRSIPGSKELHGERERRKKSCGWLAAPDRGKKAVFLCLPVTVGIAPFSWEEAFPAPPPCLA